MPDCPDPTAVERLRIHYVRQRKLQAEWSAWAEKQSQPCYANDAALIARQLATESEHTAELLRSLGAEVPTYP